MDIYTHALPPLHHPPCVHTLHFVSFLLSLRLLPLHSSSLSNNPSIFVLEWGSNVFHLCVFLLQLRGPGLPLFIHSPSSPLHLLSNKTLNLVPLSFKVSISLHTGAPLGPGQQGVVSLNLCTPDIIESGSWWKIWTNGQKKKLLFTDLKFWKTSKFSGDEVSQFSLAGNQSDIENTENSF